VSLFLPTSGCGPSCLPSDSPRVGPLRFAGRMVAAACVLLAFVVAPKRPAVVRAVARALLAALGLPMRVRGKLRPGLLVANHISWVDIVAVMALEGDVRLVAKREVGAWPVIGGLAARQHAIFIDRESPRGLPAVVNEAAQALREGATVAVFPEGTTGCGACPVPMRPAFFQAALDAGVPVTPVTLSFSAAGQRSTVAAFIGDETLLTSLKRLAWARGLRLDVVAGAPIFPDSGADRRSLARVASTAIGEGTRAAGIAPARRGRAATPAGRAVDGDSRDISRAAVPLAPLAMR
jgi:1-acyl-sn-glycerol-3-phosphate acyltransferase